MKIATSTAGPVIVKAPISAGPVIVKAPISASIGGAIALNITGSVATGNTVATAASPITLSSQP